MAVLAADITAAYRARVTGGRPDWAPLAAQYADYALWQHRVLGAAQDPLSLAAP